ncbi:MAG: preprotein translocase subunit YajC [Oscillospiraceae bacterium]|nr:preprotein translocase subunit YajC [Oscillospiraceae bacterium]
MVLPFALLIGVMYFLMIRPESKRKKQMARMLNELIVGDEVTTRGGIIGKIVSIKDDTVTVETGADKVRIKFVRDAISSKKAPISD